MAIILLTIVSHLTGALVPPFISLLVVKALIRAGLVQGCQSLRDHLGGADDPIEVSPSGAIAS